MPFTLPSRHMQCKFNNNNTHTDTKQQKHHLGKETNPKDTMLIVSANCHNQNMLDTHINVL